MNIQGVPVHLCIIAIIKTLFPGQLSRGHKTGAYQLSQAIYLSVFQALHPFLTTCGLTFDITLPAL